MLLITISVVNWFSEVRMCTVVSNMLEVYPTSLLHKPVEHFAHNGRAHKD